FCRVTRLSVAVLLLFCAGVEAQESASGGITGQVLDSTHAGVPGATVTVINAGTNAQRVATTDTDGRFTVPNLPPAGYVLRVELSAGVTPQSFTRGTQFGAAGSSRSLYITVEGGRDSSTNYAIDGVYVRSLRFNNLSLTPPLDAVQEVNVLRNSFTTEYGQGQ